MSNIIKLKHGLSVPIPDNLEQYELGYAQRGLYIKDESNQILKLSFNTLENNTIPESDAPELWAKLGNCIIIYTSKPADFDFPSDTGMLIQFSDYEGGNNCVQQIWLRKDFGQIFNRAGSYITWESIGTMTWEKIYTSRDVIPIVNGGTGANSASSARANLGLGALATVDSITLSDNIVIGILPILKGGTGASTAIDACSNLGAARVEAPNNLVHSSNEFTFIPKDFNGAVWFNFRAYNGTGEIDYYIFGKGKQTSTNNYADIYAKQLHSPAAAGVSWYRGRDKAAVRNYITIDSGFHPVVAAASNQGYWSLGCIGNDTDNRFYFSHVLNSNYNAGNNVSTNCYITTDGSFSGTAANVYGTVAIGNGGTGMTSSYTSGSTSWSGASASSTAIRKYYNGLIFFGFSIKLTSQLAADAKRTIGTTTLRPVGKMAVLAVYTTGNSYSYDISMSVSTGGNINIQNNGSTALPTSVNIYAAGVGLA